MKLNPDGKNLSDCASLPRSEGDTPVLSGTEVGTDTPLKLSRYDPEAEIELGSAIVQTVWAWILELRMRLKIKRDLGRKPTQYDLASIETWMKVDEVERRKRSEIQPTID